MSDHLVTREHGETKGRLVIRHGGGEAELAYSITTPTLIIADHTAVPDSFRGTGAGLALVEAQVAAARTDGFKIVPLCPFVNATREEASRMGRCLHLGVSRRSISL